MSDLDESRDMFDSQEIDEPAENWRGVPLSRLKSGDFSPWPSVCHSSMHSVLFKLPILSDDSPLEPHPSRPSDVWDMDNVRMPHSSQNFQTIQGQLTPKWALIKESLGQTISTSREFEKAILSYHPSSCSNWSFKALHSFFSSTLEKTEATNFFDTLLPRIIRLALEIEDKFRGPLPLLKKGRNRSVSMSQIQAGVLLANAFLCTFPRRATTQSDRFPSINFSRLFQCESPSVQQKLKCFLNYFRRITSERPRGVITFTRRSISADSLPKWRESNVKLAALHVSQIGTIEDEGASLMEVDFANRIVGGGVLGFGCVQEEIKFLICPELVVARLFTEVLTDSEALIVTGCERFNAYKGYGGNFTWSGDYKEKKNLDVYRRNKSIVVAIDALSFQGKQNQQYRLENINRELNKAFAGFSSGSNSIATGNWGCGVFGGDVQLKSIIQIMAASVCCKSVAYFTFSNRRLMEDLHEIHSFLVEKNITVGILWQILISYADSDSFKNKIPVFEHIVRVLADEVEPGPRENSKMADGLGESTDQPSSSPPLSTPSLPESVDESPKNEPLDSTVTEAELELTKIANGFGTPKQLTVASFTMDTEEGKRRCLSIERERWKAYETAMSKFKSTPEASASNPSFRRSSGPVKRKITDYFQKNC